MRKIIRPSFAVALILSVLTIVPLVLFATVRANQTVVPLGPSQGQIRTAYRAAFEHISQNGRLHWAQHAFDATDPITATHHPAGTLVAPDGISGSGFDTLVVSGTTNLHPALALDASTTRIAIFRSTVSDPHYGNAAWELADVRETFDSYLWGALRYDILDEQALITTDLSDYAIIILPTVRQGNEEEVVDAIGQPGLDALNAFVQQGGFLYAQSNGAYIAERAGVIADGTVDMAQTITLTSTATPNNGHLTVSDPTSPLAFSWLTDTLYLLSDPTYHPDAALTTVALLDNLNGAAQPAISPARWARDGSSWSTGTRPLQTIVNNSRSSSTR